MENERGRANAKIAFCLYLEGNSVQRRHCGKAGQCGSSHWLCQIQLGCEGYGEPHLQPPYICGPWDSIWAQCRTLSLLTSWSKHPCLTDMEAHCLISYSCPFQPLDYLAKWQAWEKAVKGEMESGWKWRGMERMWRTRPKWQPPYWGLTANTSI